MRPSLLPRTIDFEAAWDTVSNGVRGALLDPQRPLSVDVIKLFRLVYDLANGTRENMSPATEVLLEEVVAEQEKSCKGVACQNYCCVLLLHRLLEQIIVSHLGEHVLPQCRGVDGIALLGLYCNYWSSMELSVLTIKGIFRYLYPEWNRANKRLPANGIWRDVVLSQLEAGVISGALQVLDQIRHGIPSDKSLVSKAARSFLACDKQSYKRLESSYLDQIGPYLHEINQLETHKSVAERLAGVVRRLRAEIELTEELLETSTRTLLEKKIAEVVVQPYASTFMRQFTEWIESSDSHQNDLSNLFWFMSKDDDCLRGFAAAMKHVVTKVGHRALESVRQSPILFISTALDVYRRFSELHATTFARHPALLDAIREGCSTFVNESEELSTESTVAAEFLAVFAHVSLRQGSRTTQRQEVEAFLERFGGDAAEAIAMALGLIRDKDVFQARYTELLCSRLLSGSYDVDAEHMMVSTVSQKISHEFGNGWRRMLSDITRSADVLSELTDKSADVLSVTSSVGLRPLILTRDVWPIRPDKVPLKPPLALWTAMETFKRWFSTERKRLEWVPSASFGIVLPKFLTARWYEWTVTFYQLLILLAFDDRSIVTNSKGLTVLLQDIQRVSGCSFDELRIAAKALERSKAILPGQNQDTYILNETYSSPSLKVSMQPLPKNKIPVSPGESTKAASETRHSTSVEEALSNRPQTVQAAIVRVAKSHRTVSYADLVKAVIRILADASFTPCGAVVKRNIECLIEKEYIERSPEDPAILHYVS